MGTADPADRTDRSIAPARLALTRVTPIGVVGVAWKMSGGHPLLLRVLLPGEDIAAEVSPEGRFRGAARAACREVDALLESIARLAEGEPAAIPLAAVDLSGVTVFGRKVLTELHAVARGEVTTYAMLATRSGRPGAARAVGQVMAANPFPLVIPCHRVIRTGGDVGGFGGGREMKRTLLAAEGIAFDDRGRVACGLITGRAR